MPAPVPSAPLPATTLDASRIPDGDACLIALKKLGVAFHEGPSKRGMKTPVIVDGPLGGIPYRPLYGNPLLCDCRLAVALSWIGPDWRAAGISEVYYSGGYSYRMSRVGRLSLHAWGLAIDIHEVTAQGRRLSVDNDFERGLDNPCASKSPLNVASCRLRARGMFRELLTPDYDSDHHDHLHLSITPHGYDPVSAKRREKKAAPASPPRKRGKQRVQPRQEPAHRGPDEQPAEASSEEAKGTGKEAVSKHVSKRDTPESPGQEPKSKHRAKPAPPPEAPPEETDKEEPAPPSDSKRTQPVPPEDGKAPPPRKAPREKDAESDTGKDTPAEPDAKEPDPKEPDEPVAPEPGEEAPKAPPPDEPTAGADSEA